MRSVYSRLFVSPHDGPRVSGCAKSLGPPTTWSFNVGGILLILRISDTDGKHCLARTNTICMRGRRGFGLSKYIVSLTYTLHAVDPAETQTLMRPIRPHDVLKIEDWMNNVIYLTDRDNSDDENGLKGCGCFYYF